jgi:hypothetical protein
VVYGKGKGTEVQSPRPNKRETEFVRRLRGYLRVNHEAFPDTFELKNIALRGVELFRNGDF